MNSIILQIASKYLRVLLLFFAVLALLRGHNQPGGGFIGGLLAALSIIYTSLAYNVKKVKEQLKIQPDKYIAIGLFLILISVFIGVVSGKPIMSGEWLSLKLPAVDTLKLGTPLLFDTGVFMAVIGVTLVFFFNMSLKK
jgi:multicomponent Na+:H+ antiporter subunit B